MNAKELRIGNLLYGHYEGLNNDKEEYEDMREVVEFVGYDPWEKMKWVSGKSGSETYDRFEPIPLTIDILEQSGFEKIWSDTYSKDGMRLKKINEHFLFVAVPFHVNVFYVHQLQNLYFALYNKEIDLKNVK